MHSQGMSRGMGPGVAEMEFEERESDPVLVFMADKTEPGAWNFFLYKIFADPFNTAGLVIDPSMHKGFVFEVHDLIEKRRIMFTCPEEIYNLLAYIGAPVAVCDQARLAEETGRSQRVDEHPAA